MKTTKKHPDQLLAAYADGGLAPDEAAEVEALLASNPEARAELEAIRRLIAEARGADDSAAEPDWDSMARAIHRACDEAPPPRLAWLWRPRRVLAIGGLAAAATAAVLFLALGRGGGQADRAPSAAIEPPPSAGVAPPSDPQLEAPTEEALPALREPEVDELSDDELAELDDELATGDLGDEGFIADLLAPGGGAGDEEDGLDVFDDHPLTADELAEELPPDAIEKLDRFLAEVSAG